MKLTHFVHYLLCSLPNAFSNNFLILEGLKKLLILVFLY